MKKPAKGASEDQNALFLDVGSDFEDSIKAEPSSTPVKAARPAKLRVRIHPFDIEKNARLSSVKKEGAECDAYIEKLKGWLIKDETIVVEDESGLVLFLWYRQGSGRLRSWVKESMT